MDTPKVQLLDGVEALRPILEPAGFVFEFGDAGSSSGGGFATGSFVRADRTVAFSVRHQLGLVTYRIGGLELSHQDYLRYSGHWNARHYPNFGTSLSDSFAALAHDLTAFFQDFLRGSGSEFASVVSKAARDPNRFKGFSALSNNGA